jgi:PhzF family phenazine biosynthesis protein
LTRVGTGAEDGAVTVPITWIDAFTDEPFAGNPAAVCVLPGAAPEPWMQSVARELGLSETAFVHREPDAWRLRWFTPTSEVDLCGHATLAAAHALWAYGHVLANDTITFHTKSGPLLASAAEPWIELDFPAEPAAPAAAPDGLLAALGLPRARWVGKNRLDWLVALDREDEVRGLAPDMAMLRGIPTRGVIVTAAADARDEYDFVSRYFAPAFGIDEDPVTGSAHCCLGPYWGERWGKETMVARQVSQRGGTVRVRLRGPRIALGGKAVLHGQLVL